MRLVVSPSLSLVDDPLPIRGEGLPANTPVYLTTRLSSEQERINFSSTSRYRTPDQGKIDVSTQHTEGGSWIHGEGVGDNTVAACFARVCVGSGKKHELTRETS